MQIKTIFLAPISVLLLLCGNAWASQPHMMQVVSPNIPEHVTFAGKKSIWTEATCMSDLIVS